MRKRPCHLQICTVLGQNSNLNNIENARYANNIVLHVLTFLSKAYVKKCFIKKKKKQHNPVFI